jgi:hypothetical protein
LVKIAERFTLLINNAKSTTNHAETVFSVYISQWNDNKDKIYLNLEKLLGWLLMNYT